MFFFSKRTTIHLDAFTYRKDVLEYYPVDYSNKFFPEWWKKLPKTILSSDGYTPKPTIKTCYGFNSFYKNSLSVPLWCDLSVNIVGDDLIWQFSDMKTFAEVHPDEETVGFLDMRYHRHLKIHSPWQFKCNEEISWIWTQPTWNFKNPTDIIILPGIIEYKYQTSTNINIIFNAHNDKHLMIDAGQNMVNLYPMTEKNVKIHRHLVDEREYSDITYLSSATKFVNKYSNNKKILKSKEKKCPFHL